MTKEGKKEEKALTKTIEDLLEEKRNKRKTARKNNLNKGKARLGKRRKQKKTEMKITKDQTKEL